jgi:hypothetical protein
MNKPFVFYIFPKTFYGMNISIGVKTKKKTDALDILKVSWNKFENTGYDLGDYIPNEIILPHVLYGRLVSGELANANTDIKNKWLNFYDLLNIIRNFVKSKKP